MKKYFLILFVPFIQCLAQETKNDEQSISVFGFIKNDFFFDSRQTISAREGHFLLYPANELLDNYGEDINSKSSFNALSIQSRLTSKLKGPEILNAKSGGLIEGEFFGTTDSDINGFRLRHVYLTLNWNGSSLLIGQTWHPMFITDAFPQAVSFNTGAPFQPFSRNPQLRFTQSFGKLNLIAVVYSQRDFTNNGPNGFNSSYMRNSLIPGSHLQVQLKNENIISGAGVDFKSLTPRIVTKKNIKTNNRITGLSYLLYLRFLTQQFNCTIEGVYGENLTDLFMLGGYAVSSEDTVSGVEDYTSIKVFSLWTDFSFGKDIQPGIFIGYTKNLGASEKVTGEVYSRASNIDY